MQTPASPRSRIANWLVLAFVMVAVVLATRWTADFVVGRVQKQRVERLPFEINLSDRAACEPVAAREGVIIARLDMQGATVFRTGPVPLSGRSNGRMLDDVDAQFPPWPARDEVRAALAGNRTLGQYRTPDGAQVMTLAQPRPDGGVLYLVSGVSRGLVTTAVLRGIEILAFVLLVVALVVRQRQRRRARPDGPPR
jgi:hypothetical protein